MLSTCIRDRSRTGLSHKRCITPCRRTRRAHRLEVPQVCRMVRQPSRLDARLLTESGWYSLRPAFCCREDGIKSNPPGIHWTP